MSPMSTSSGGLDLEAGEHSFKRKKKLFERTTYAHSTFRNALGVSFSTKTGGSGGPRRIKICGKGTPRIRKKGISRWPEISNSTVSRNGRLT